MHVTISDAAASFIEEEGGRLYVWPTKARCGGGRFLRAATAPPRRVEFARRGEVQRFELYMPAAFAPVPEELLLELRRFPRRVEAYWNGCVWIG